MSKRIEDGHDLDGWYLGGMYKVICWNKDVDYGDYVLVAKDGECAVCGKIIEAIKKGIV